MQNSPHYNVFEEVVMKWDDKLQKIYSIFNGHIDAQRKWIYLEGLFIGNDDLRNVIPAEVSRFQSVNSEFLGNLKKIQKACYVIEVINSPKLLESTDRIIESLDKIQKTLGDYLEKQRIAFPRFYFIGEEDLLEIIGNTKDISRIEKHLSKMFAGIHSLIFDSVGASIVAVKSKEDEIISLEASISLQNKTVIEWLTLLDSGTKTSLSNYLVTITSEIRANLNEDGLILAITNHPSQLVILSLQILWTELVESSFEPNDITFKSIIAKISSQIAQITTGIMTCGVFTRKKFEQTIIELLHQRNVVVELEKHKISSKENVEWQFQLRYYLSSTEDPMQRVSVKMANTCFYYGFEFLGFTERLVQTPLTNRCYLTLTQAIHYKLGGSPFGYAYYLFINFSPGTTN